MDKRRKSARIELPIEGMTKTVRRREKPKERWLLTRKTWKYMADAGRRLIPEGAQNRIEDVPRIEKYFQEVCAKEPRFLLWRKSSYPGALPRPRRKKRTRGGSVRARSPSEDSLPPVRPTDLFIGHTSGGRFDMAKMKRDFLAAPPAPAPVPARVPPEPVEDDDSTLLEMLRKYLKVEEDEGVGRVSDADELVRALRKYLSKQGERDERDEAARRLASRPDDHPDTSQRSLLETLGRYYNRSPNRDHIVQDLLTDRKLLKKLYHDLRKSKSYGGGRGGGYVPGVYGGAGGTWRGGLRTRFAGRDDDTLGRTSRDPPLSPPPLIEVRGESLEERTVDCGTQTLPIPEEVLLDCERLYREKIEAETAPTSPTSPPPQSDKSGKGRRRSSVDHDDVSQSVSDTIKRYLRMARKKSVDADKADRFKRINYDKNLRNIKPKMRGEFDDDAFNKGCQTDEEWILSYRDLKFASVPCSPVSPPPSPASGHSPSFLSSLLGRSAPTVCPPSPSGGMQKSRSSSSVVQSVSKRIWKTRSRSSSRVAANWTPQGSCAWVDGSGRAVRLTDTSLLTLSEVERKALQQAALARLQQLNLGCSIKIPEESSSVNSKPKRRAYLLKRKALTTGFFDQSRPKDDKDKDGAGSVFGVPLAQCVETERALRRQQHGSRTSLASLGALERGDDSESCDSGEWGSSSDTWAGLDEGAAGAGGPRVPALVSACLSHLRRHGLHTLGLFRVSSSKKRVRQLREEWERGGGGPGGGGGQEAAMDAATCPHDVATLLKEFLRDLPDPLLCKDLYSAFLHTQKIRNRKLQWEALRLVIQLLPAAHRDTLGALLGFLSQLAACATDTKHSPGNKMDAANLATVFAPNILHRNKPGDQQASTEQLSERADVINVVRLLIEKQSELWTLPAELLHEAYIHLSHTAPAHLDTLLLRRAECAVERLRSACGADTGESGADGAERRVWSREECLHGSAAMGGPDRDYGLRRSEKMINRMRRTRETASDTSSGSLSSAMTIVTRVRSSMEECGSSGVVCSPPPSAPHSATTSARTDSADSADSASDYNETVGGSDDDSCVITASLHIPAAFNPSNSPGVRRSPAAPPRRRRSTSGSESSNKRDSAVGSGTTPSSPASWASSPPASPPPAAATPVRVTLTSAGEIRKRREDKAKPQGGAAELDRLLGLGRERNTSDARAVVLRQRDDSHPVTQSSSSTTLYKRGELISSARPPP